MKFQPFAVEVSVVEAISVSSFCNERAFPDKPTWRKEERSIWCTSYKKIAWYINKQINK